MIAITTLMRISFSNESVYTILKIKLQLASVEASYEINTKHTNAPSSFTNIFKSLDPQYLHYVLYKYLDTLRISVNSDSIYLIVI